MTPIKGMEILASYASRRYENKQDKFQNTYDTYEGGNFIMTYPTTKSRYEEWYQLIKNQFNAQVTYENTFNERHYFKGFWDFKPMSSKISRLVVHVIIITMMATRK